MFKLSIYQNKKLWPLKLENGAVLAAALTSSLNNPKTLKLTVKRDLLDYDIAAYLTSDDCQLLLEFGDKKWLMSKQSNQFKYILPVVPTQNTNGIVVLDDTVIYEQPFSVNHNIKVNFFNKRGSVIVNGLYAGNQEKTRLLIVQDNNTNTPPSPNRLYQIAVNSLNRDLSLVQRLENNILELTFYSSLFFLDYEIPKLAYGTVFTGNKKDILSTMYPSIIWNIEEGTVKNYEVPIKQNTEIVNEIRTNQSLIDYDYDLENNRPVFKIASLQNENANVYAPQQLINSYFDNKPIPTRVQENYPSVNMELITKEWIQEGSKILVRVFDNETQYQAKYLLDGFSSFDLLNNFNTINASVTMISRSDVKPRPTDLQLIYNTIGKNLVN